MKHYAKHSRNLLDPKKRTLMVYNIKNYENKYVIAKILAEFPKTVHDPTTFSIDVLKSDVSCLFIDLKVTFLASQGRKSMKVM